MTAGLLVALERFLLPNRCVGCNRPHSDPNPDALICGPCRTRLHRLPPGCPRCQQPLPPVGPCRFCRDWSDRLRRARSAVWLDDRARPIVHRLKYGGLRRLADDIALVMERTIPRPSHGLLVPVPLGPARHRQRGYNQAAVLARALAVAWRRPVAAHILARITDTPTQTRLTPAERQRNVAKAFCASPPPCGHGDAGRRTVILVDDVLTTGATLTACASALGEAGWDAADAVTFARAFPDGARVA